MTSPAPSASVKATLASRFATRVLLLIALATAVAVFIAAERVDAKRASALASGRDLTVCRDELRDLDAWQAGVRTADGSTSGDPELNRRIRSAATSASILDQLASVEPGPPIRVRDSNVTRTAIYLRLDGVTLRQVARFVNALTVDDASLKATGIEFSALPTGTIGAGSSEIWTADVTLSASTISPHDDPAR